MADIRLSTPTGIAVYPRLKTPDTKFNELGIYKADVAIPKAEAEDLMEQLCVIWKGHTGKAAKRADNPMFEMETDEGGEETGNVIFKIRVKNIQSKKTGELWDRRPKLFDAELKPIDVNPWGGSKMVVSFDVHKWEYNGKTGVSLQPVGVQILDLKTGSGPDASSYGFGAQEGYVAPDPAGDVGLTDTVTEEPEGDTASTPSGADY